MIIDCISDLHGYFPVLEGGDLLIVAGDLTARDNAEGHLRFYSWLQRQNYKRYIVVAGNHDNLIQEGMHLLRSLAGVDYLEDSGCEFGGLKIWGSPWTAAFPGMNPNAMAFTMPFGCDTEEHLQERFDMIPDDTDILITHSPPHGCYLDQLRDGTMVGSCALRDRVVNLDLKLHVFGHIHEGYGKHMECVNASHVNEYYKPVNNPIRVIL